MRTKFKAAVGSLLISGVLAGAAVMPATSQAAVPGQVCHVHSFAAPAPVLDFTGTSGVLYYLGAGAGFRIAAYNGNYYLGNGNGQPQGLIYRTDLDQASCHW
ncbi:MAG: hypothetical protein WC558_00645 [Patulibacter sp.]